jgi:hypothetical protein
MFLFILYERGLKIMADKIAMFHVTHLRSPFVVLTMVLLCAFAAAGPCAASGLDGSMSRRIASLLGEEFSPESLSVTVRESRAYAEMRGVVLSGIRIDTMKLDALLTGGERALSADIDSLAGLIGYSRGEMILLEKDVNAYFDNNDTRGFSKLKFDFTPQGFKANGLFSADFIFHLRIRLAAAGVLDLESDGLYLQDVTIHVEKIKQPAALTDKIVARINPLIKWSDIPFKVEFRRVTMSDDAAMMTGDPQQLEGGSRTVWAPPK